MKCKYCGTEYKGSYCPNCGSNNPNYHEEPIKVEEEIEEEPEVIITKEKKEEDNRPQKSRIAMLILALLFGTFGIQHFYIGKPFLGVMCILFCWTGIPSLAGLIEAIIILFEDEKAFEFKYKVKCVD